MKTLLLLAPLLVSTILGNVLVKDIHTSYIGAQDGVLAIDKFFGIPYAQPPIGKLRLQPPQALKPHSTVVNASCPASNKCYGIENYMLRAGSEDCLTLDVMRPSGAKKELLPVMVFINGYVLLILL